MFVAPLRLMHMLKCVFNTNSDFSLLMDGDIRQKKNCRPCAACMYIDHYNRLNFPAFISTQKSYLNISRTVTHSLKETENLSSDEFIISPQSLASYCWNHCSQDTFSLKTQTSEWQLNLERNNFVKDRSQP